MNDIFTGIVTSFEQKIRVLESKKLRSFDQVCNSVEKIKAKISVIQTAKELKLTNNEELKTLACQFSDEAYCETVVDLLAKVLPVMDPGEYLEDGNYVLIAELVGMNAWSMEEACEMADGPDYFGEQYSLINFLLMLNFMITDESSWNTCTDYFQWPIGEIYELKSGVGFDEKYLKSYLARHGAPKEVFTTVMLTFFPPEQNDILAVSGDDLECDPGLMEVEITPENIRILRHQWDEARNLISQIEPAKQWIYQNPWFIPILGEGLEKSQNTQMHMRRISAEQGWPA